MAGKGLGLLDQIVPVDAKFHALGLEFEGLLVERQGLHVVCFRRREQGVVGYRAVFPSPGDGDHGVGRAERRCRQFG